MILFLITYYIHDTLYIYEYSLTYKNVKIHKYFLQLRIHVHVSTNTTYFTMWTNGGYKHRLIKYADLFLPF